VGQLVLLKGTNFNGTYSVQFNTTPAVFLVNSATQITVVVPTGATSGSIKVTTPGGSITKTGFTVLP
jgi:uncharacterized protein (TIGR03437 family)